MTASTLICLRISSSSLLLSSLELSDTRVYEPSIRALLETGSHFCEVVVQLRRPSWFVRNVQACWRIHRKRRDTNLFCNSAAFGATIATPYSVRRSHEPTCQERLPIRVAKDKNSCQFELQISQSLLHPPCALFQPPRERAATV